MQRSSCHGASVCCSLHTHSSPPVSSRRTSFLLLAFPSAASPSPPYAASSASPSAAKLTSTSARAPSVSGSRIVAARIETFISEWALLKPPTAERTFSAQSASISCPALRRKRLRRATLAESNDAVCAPSLLVSAVLRPAVPRSSGTWHSCSSASTGSVCTATAVSSSRVCVLFARRCLRGARRRVRASSTGTPGRPMAWVRCREARTCSGGACAARRA